jgi:hypothetical protein
MGDMVRQERWSFHGNGLKDEHADEHAADPAPSGMGSSRAMQRPGHHALLPWPAWFISFRRVDRRRG